MLFIINGNQTLKFLVHKNYVNFVSTLNSNMKNGLKFVGLDTIYFQNFNVDGLCAAIPSVYSQN